MGDFQLYFELGLKHVLDWQAYDHVLFIVVMSAVHIGLERKNIRLLNWKSLLLLVTAFTLGHTFSLFLSNYGYANPPSWLIELLIPITILITAVFNIVNTLKRETTNKLSLLLFLTFFFGLIHGFGFGRYFNHISDEKEIMPLVSFALGIEAAQLIVVLLLLFLGLVLQLGLGLKRKIWIWITSIIVVIFTLPMLIENLPW